MRFPQALAAFTLALSLAPAAGRAEAPARSKLLVNTTGKTVIRKVILGNDMTVAIVSRAGTSVVCDPSKLMSPSVVPDVITVSHGHHLNQAYLDEAKGAKALVQQVGSWTVKDLRITGLPASHGERPVDAAAPTIVTYLFEVDGLRIAYLSCIGQRQLEPAQLAALGKVDVALVSEENSDAKSSSRAAEAARDLVRQLGARIVVPLSHHLGDMEFANDILAELAGGNLETVNGELALSPDDLKGTGQRVIHVLPTNAP